jgi:hypothetical protein
VDQLFLSQHEYKVAGAGRFLVNTFRNHLFQAILNSLFGVPAASGVGVQGFKHTYDAPTLLTLPTGMNTVILFMRCMTGYLVLLQMGVMLDQDFFNQ